jgi:hypothetical protein
VKALALVEEADRASQGKGQFLFRFASEMEELREDPLAVQAFQKAAVSAPGIDLKAEALERAAQLETRRRRYREAVALYGEIARLQPAGPRGRGALLESARLSITSLRDPAGAPRHLRAPPAMPGMASDQRARVQLRSRARNSGWGTSKGRAAYAGIVSPPADRTLTAEALYRLAEISFFRLDFKTASKRFEGGHHLPAQRTRTTPSSATSSSREDDASEGAPPAPRGARAGGRARGSEGGDRSGTDGRALPGLRPPRRRAPRPGPRLRRPTR